MATFASYDATQLHYEVHGTGSPVVCLPGGPGRSVDYLGTLGGLDRSHELIMLDPRGVGASDDPANPATFRADQLVDDVEALRMHLGLEQMDLLAHSAGAVLATLYAARFPGRLSKLLLITPSLAALGVSSDESEYLARIERTAPEPWHAEALTALEALRKGDLSIGALRESRPLFYDSWAEPQQIHAMSGVAQRHQAARIGYFDGLDLDVAATRAALTQLTAPVLLYGGQHDPLITPGMLREAAGAFADPTVVIQQNAAHFPWVDNGTRFADAVKTFMALGRAGTPSTRPN